MAKNPLMVEGGQIILGGSPVLIRARLSGKIMGLLERRRDDYCKRWIDHNRALEINALRVPFEEMQPRPGFEGPPVYRPSPLPQMAAGNRVKEKQIDRDTLTKLYALAEATGIIIILVIDYTLLNIKAIRDAPEGKGAGMIGHVISRTLEVCRKVSEEYPRAAIVFDFHNGWNIGAVKIEGRGSINMSARRCRRWSKGKWPNNETELSFTQPGAGWEAEQYPGAIITASEVAQKPSYKVRSNDVTAFQLGSIVADKIPASLPRRPLMIGETISWATDDNADQYVEFLGDCERKHIHVCVCDPKGAQTDLDMPRSKLERLLGDVPPPPPPPPPEEWETVWRAERLRVQKLIG